MPFTLSHAAAVLPGLRTDGSGRGPLVPAVLVAGSFAPDMTYYAAGVVPGAMEFGDVTHSFPGVFTVDVPVAWALVGLWALVREPLVALLPRARQGRWAALLHCGAPRARAGAATAARWYLSAVLGALTHVVWDAFTHHDRWGTRLVPVLGREAAGRPVYWYAQYGSSAVAAVVIAAFVLFALCRTPTRPVAARSTAARPTVAGPAAARPAEGSTGSAGERAEDGFSGVPVLSARDRWWAASLIGGCVLAGAVQRVSRGWVSWDTALSPLELIPTLCFGVGAGLVAGLLLYAVGVRVRRPAPGACAGRPEDVDEVGNKDGVEGVSVGRGRP
ncbi:DUF4184 family protein [Streptomyces sp. NPDC059766]|uniref:DUF4184 family protein n=1 Tax=Streptomyces sp. NPDC059766 TaxID=3346940 RepID=UPI00365C8C04